MNRREARRFVSAGALVALAVWVGGLPAAAADENAPGIPTAAATAASVVGDDTLTGVTFRPAVEPAVGPAARVASPQPNSSREPSPTPEPSATGFSNTGDPEQPSPVAPEPVPTFTDVPPTTNADQFHTATTSPAEPTESTSAPVEGTAEEVEAENETPTASIAPFDCQALSTTATLDNSRVPAPTVFTVQALDNQRIVVDRTITVAPGASETLIVPLIANARNQVFVLAADGQTLASHYEVCGTLIENPRATIGTFDCGSLTVTVILDNTRSNTSIKFNLWAKYSYIDHYRLIGSQSLFAGELRQLRATIDDSTITKLIVNTADEAEAEGGPLATASGPLCGLVTVSGVDCIHMTVSVALHNNSNSDRPRHFTVNNRQVVLHPGGREIVVIPAREATKDGVHLSELEFGKLFEKGVTATCQTSVQPAAEPPTSQTPALAATGAGATMKLVLLGLAMLANGVALVMGTRTKEV